MTTQWRTHLLTPEMRELVRTMWSERHLDTHQISKLVGAPEAAIYNYLADHRVWQRAYQRNNAEQVA